MVQRLCAGGSCRRRQVSLHPPALQVGLSRCEAPRLREASLEQRSDFNPSEAEGGDGGGGGCGR